MIIYLVSARYSSFEEDWSHAIKAFKNKEAAMNFELNCSLKFSSFFDQMAKLDAELSRAVAQKDVYRNDKNAYGKAIMDVHAKQKALRELIDSDLKVGEFPNRDIEFVIDELEYEESEDD